MKLRHKLNRLSLLITVLGAPALATAQQASGSAPETSEAEASSFEKIVVTARKRAETLQDIPLAVTALDKNAIARSAINTLADLQTQVPSLTIYAARGTSSTATAYIRGIGQSDPLWGVEPGVGIYLNDVYLSRPQGALLDMLDVERVEILRGPQGTLYGRNTIGGAIKYITARPSDDFSGNADLAVGSYGQLDARVALSGALLENTLLGSFAFGSFNRDGFGKNRETGEEVSNKDLMTARASLLWLASDNLSLNIALDKTQDRSNVRGAQHMLVNDMEAYFSGQPPLPVSTDRYDVNNGFDIQRNDTDTRGASLTLNWDGGYDWMVKYVAAWRDGNSDGAIDFDLGPYPIADVDANYFDQQVSQEVQFNYNGDDLQAVFGLYWLDAEAGGMIRNRFGIPFAALGLAPVTMIPGPIFNQYGVSAGQVDTRSMAFYSDASWQFIDHWSLSAGFRAGRETKTVEVLNQNFTDDTFTGPNGQISADFNNEKSWNDISPRLSIDYKPNDDLLIYASIAKGFKSGGFNIRANQAQVPESANAYQPESVLTYEIGIKPAITEHLQLSLGLFQSNYKDIQLSIFTGLDTDNDGNNDAFFGDFTNAGRGDINGVELEFQWSTGKAFRLWGNAAYLDASYDEYISGGVNIAEQQEFTDIPRLAYALNAQWQTALGNFGNLAAVILYSWRDEVQPVTNQSDLLKQPAFGLWNAQLILTPNDSQWRVALEAKNLADKHYRTTGYDLRDSGFPIVTGYYGDPRTLTLRLSYGF